METDPKRVAERIERLRGNRKRTEPARAITESLGRAAESLRAQQRKSSGLGAVWQTLCPTHLIDRTSVESLRRGTATIRVEDASTRFELDRWLRTGGLDDLIHASPAALRRVKLVLGPLADTR
jgi:glycerophosphoryl diester phosphodiesterase